VRLVQSHTMAAESPTPATASTATASVGGHCGFPAPVKLVAAKSLATRHGRGGYTSWGIPCRALGAFGIALTTRPLRQCGAGPSKRRRGYSQRGRGGFRPTAATLEPLDSAEAAELSDSVESVRKVPSEPVAPNSAGVVEKAVPGTVLHHRYRWRRPGLVAAFTTALMAVGVLTVLCYMGRRPLVVAAARLTARVGVAGMLATVSLALVKTLIERTFKVALEAIDRSLLGVDIRIRRSSLTFFRPKDGGIKVVLCDVEIGNPEGFDEDRMMSAKQVELEFELWHFLWTWISPRKKQIEINGATLTDVHVMYETLSPELGLANSNVSTLINFIRERLGYTSTGAVASKNASVTGEPSFHLHRLKTDGLSASVSVGGVDLPIEHTEVPIADIDLDDLTGDIRSNLARVRELKAEGGGLAPMVRRVVEVLNERVVDQLRLETLDKGATLLSDTFHAAASEATERFNELDTDGDGSVSAKEIAFALWARLGLEGSNSPAPQKDA